MLSLGFNEINVSTGFENPSFKIFLVTTDGSVSYKVFDLSEIDSVENGAWKRYRYSLKSKSEIEDLTIKFLAKSGDRDMSIIAWDNVKLEYTEPETEGNNGELSKIIDQADNTTVQETHESNSVRKGKSRFR